MPKPPKTYAKSYYGAVNDGLNPMILKHSQCWFTDFDIAGRGDGPTVVLIVSGSSQFRWFRAGRETKRVPERIWV